MLFNYRNAYFGFTLFAVVIIVVVWAASSFINSKVGLYLAGVGKQVLAVVMALTPDGL